MSHSRWQGRVVVVVEAGKPHGVSLPGDPTTHMPPPAEQRQVCAHCVRGCPGPGTPAPPPTPYLPIGLDPRDYLYPKVTRLMGSKDPAVATPSGPGFASTASVISRPAAKIRTLRWAPLMVFF